jgi:hypothetical protein
MSPFWGSFFDHFRGCGRNATLFMVIFALFAVGITVASLSHLFQYANEFFAVLAVFVLIRVCIAVSRFRKQGGDRLHRRPLSCDELRKARSKLLRGKQNGFSQPRY